MIQSTFHRTRRGRPALLVLCLAPLLAVLVAALAGCNNDEKKMPPPPTPTVSVSEPLLHDVVDWDDYIGTLQSPNAVSLSARVSGMIVQADFTEGSMVQQGKELYLIDPRPYQADLDTKKAAVKQAQAQKDQAEAHFNRYANIIKSGSQAVSQDDYDTAKAARDQADAQLNSANAAEESAQLNLDWTKVTAPVKGRIGYKQVTVGNLVNGGSGQPTRLTTIVSIDPMYCYIAVPELVFLKYNDLEHYQEHQQKGESKTALNCYFELQDEKNFPHPGHIDFIDNQVNPATGTIKLRGVFPNPDGKLVPGSSGRMRIPESAKYQAILIPDAAVNSLQNEQYLLIVGDNDVVEQRLVKLGRLYGSLRTIISGLKAGERVIVNGLQDAHPGGKVKPVEAPIPPEAIKMLEDLEKTAEGSPATQELPATGPASEPVHPNASSVSLRAGARPEAAQ